MSEQAARLLEQVQELPPDDQKAVRRALRDRRRAELEDEEARIVRERSDLLHSGTAELLDGAEVMSRLRRRLEAKYGTEPGT